MIGVGLGVGAAVVGAVVGLDVIISSFLMEGSGVGAAGKGAGKGAVELFEDLDPGTVELFADLDPTGGSIHDGGIVGGVDLADLALEVVGDLVAFPEPETPAALDALAEEDEE